MMHTVLVVEDEAELREMMTEALEWSGYTVVAVDSGNAALAALPGIEQLCLVLLDLLMPDMNGWELLECFRERPELRDVPVVVHSSVSTPQVTGAVRVIRKPVELDTLMGVVREYCAA